jgi:hypothetical protein
MGIFSTPKDKMERLIVKVKDRVPNAENIRCLLLLPNFLNGQLYTFSFDRTDTQTGQVKTESARVYYRCLPDESERIDVYTNDDILLEILGETHSPTEGDFFRVDTIAGIIAVLLTLTICVRSFWPSDTQIPAILQNALTVILGFYFGRASLIKTVKPIELIKEHED